MKKCCISSCPKPENLVCFDIPKDLERRKEWMININRDPNVLSVTNDDAAAAVCSLHFKQSDYIYLLHGDQTTKRKISEHSVPSVFPWTHDWYSNYTAEMEIAQLNERSSHSTDSQTSIPNMGLPEGEAVQLGNVESLGINTYVAVVENACPDSSANDSNRLSTENRKNLLMKSIQSKSTHQGIQLSTSTSNSTSRVETSEDEDINCFNILSQIHYSCTGCEFKSKDIISLKEHRMKHHPEVQLESPNVNRTERKCHETRNSETPIRQCHTQEENKYSSQLPVQAFQCDEKGKKRKSSCVKGPRESKDNHLGQQKHGKETDFGIEVSVVNHSQTSSKNMDPSSALFSKKDSSQPSKRHVRNCYPCTQCSFRTPNARKLKAHVKQYHRVTANTSKEQQSRLALPKENEMQTSCRAFPGVSQSDLKKRRIKGHLYYLCPAPNCSYRAKDSRRIFHHCQADHDLTIDQNYPCSNSYLKKTMSSSLASSDQEPCGTSKTSDNTGPGRYFCESCNYSVNKKSRLKNHRRRHTENSGYRCSICSYTVPMKRQLTYHVTNHHSEGFSCNLCNYKAKTLTEKNNHHASAHKAATAGKTSSHSSEQLSNSDCDLQHVCSQCSFKTSSRERFDMHEKTHVPDSVGSSTEELDIEDTQKKTTRKMKRKREDSSSSIRTVKLIERLVYQCPHCSFWARAVSSFHQHLMAHEKKTTFKCSHCDFSSRYRTAITKHIKESPKETHRSACWNMTKPVPENQYPEYLKTSLIPELEYSGTRKITNLVSDEELKREALSDSSDSSWKLSGESSLANNTDDGSRDWVPSSSLSSAQMRDDSSSSLSFEITSDSSSEYDRKPSSSSSASSDSRSEAENQSSVKNSPTTDMSSSSLTNGIVLRSSSRTRRHRRKRLRIHSDEEIEQQSPLKPATVPASNDAGDEEIKLSVLDVQQETNIQPQILATFPQGRFPVLDDALAERQAMEQKVKEAQDRINEMRTEQLKMVETDSASETELLKLKERKNVAEQRLMKLCGQKIEAELQLRTEQCQELKFSLAMYEPGQESEFNKSVLVESQKLVSKTVVELEAKLTEIKKAIADLREEIEILDCQMKESEESHAGAAQLLEIFESEMSEKETELVRLQEDLAKSVSNIRQLVAEERKLIGTRTTMCKEELKRLYMKGLSKIREKERDLLNALDGYVSDKSVSPNVSETI